jgi:hypothetical protein
MHAYCVSLPRKPQHLQSLGTQTQTTLPRYFRLKPDPSYLQPACMASKLSDVESNNTLAMWLRMAGCRRLVAQPTMVNEDVRLVVASGILRVEAPDDHGVRHAV